jgi:hypothetical protein
LLSRFWRARRSLNLASWRRREGIVERSGTRFAGDEGYEILSKPSASSLHQIQHIHEPVPVVSSQRWSKNVRGQPSQRKFMSPLSATISPVNKQHYEGLLRAANAVGTYSDRDIAFQEA